MQHRSIPAIQTLSLAVLLAAPAVACDKSGDTKAPDGASTPTVTHRETAPDAVMNEDPNAMDDSVSDAMTPSEQDEALRAESEANQAAEASEDDEYEEYDEEDDEADYEEDDDDGGA